jgi:hypothetical protein
MDANRTRIPPFSLAEKPHRARLNIEPFAAVRAERSSDPLGIT